eukprot:gene6806-4886_t
MYDLTEGKRSGSGEQKTHNNNNNKSDSLNVSAGVLLTHANALTAPNLLLYSTRKRMIVTEPSGCLVNLLLPLSFFFFCLLMGDGISRTGFISLLHYRVGVG